MPISEYKRLIASILELGERVKLTNIKDEGVVTHQLIALSRRANNKIKHTTGRNLNIFNCKKKKMAGICIIIRGIINFSGHSTYIVDNMPHYRALLFLFHINIHHPSSKNPPSLSSSLPISGTSEPCCRFPLALLEPSDSGTIEGCASTRAGFIDRFCGILAFESEANLRSWICTSAVLPFLAAFSIKSHKGGRSVCDDGAAMLVSLFLDPSSPSAPLDETGYRLT